MREFSGSFSGRLRGTNFDTSKLCLRRHVDVIVILLKNLITISPFAQVSKTPIQLRNDKVISIIRNTLWRLTHYRRPKFNNWRSPFNNIIIMRNCDVCSRSIIRNEFASRIRSMFIDTCVLENSHRANGKSRQMKSDLSIASRQRLVLTFNIEVGFYALNEKNWIYPSTYGENS